MKTLFAAALAAVLSCGAAAQTAQTTQTAHTDPEHAADNAGNLFIKSSSFNPFADRIARHVGDIVTIVISENSNSAYSASTSTTKSDSNSISNGIPLLQGIFSAASTGANSSVAGTGATQSTGALTAQMTVTVKEVLPNGNLVIEGTRSIKTNKDTQTFKLSGTIRPDDIRSDNTILSASIGDAHIEVDGKGQIADRQRRGILTRVLDWLF